MSRLFPPLIRTRSEIERCNNFRIQALQQFMQIALPLSSRIIDVKTKMRSLRLRRPYTFLQHDIEDACDTFDRCIAYFTNCLNDPDYVVCGNEVSTAERDLNSFARRAERSLEMLQNVGRVRRMLSY